MSLYAFHDCVSSNRLGITRLPTATALIPTTLRFILLRCGDLERRIQRAERHCARDQEDDGEQAENDCDGAGDLVREVKNGDDKCQQNPNQAVCVSHILFHENP